MTQNDLQRMYGSTPVSFQQRVAQTLTRPSAFRAPRAALRVALITALLTVLTLGVCAAVFGSQVADIFGWFYGDRMKQELLNGNIAQQEQSVQIGDVIYTLQEVVYIDDGLYGVGRISPASDSVVLLAEDYQLTDEAGYGLYYGPESRAPSGAPTYAELARQKNAKVLQVSTVAEAVGVDGGTVLPLACVGYSLIPQLDGSVQFTFEIPTGVAVEQGSEYTIRLWSANWEVAEDGTWLCEEPNDTYQGQSWDAVVFPKPAKERK